MAELAHATGIDYLYNGQYGVETDANGLYYMRARYYNQDIKRFINRDVVSGDISNSQSLNRYCYVQGNPVSLTDPFGLCPDGNSEDGVSKDSAIGWLLYKIDPSGGLFDKYSNDVSPLLHTLLDVGGIFHDGADAFNGILYFLEGNTKLGIEYTLRGLTFYGALIGGPVGVAMILLGIGFNIGFAVRGTAGAIDRAYTDYQNGTLGWHNLADLGLNGLAVAGGMHVGAKSLLRAADMSGPRTITAPKTIGKVESGRTSRGVLSEYLGIGEENVYGRFYSVKNKQGGEVYVSIDEISADDFANIVEAANGKARINIISGIHGDKSGNVFDAEDFYFEDVRDFQNMNVNVFNYTKMDFKEISNVINSQDITICAWCYSEKNPTIRMALKLGKR